MAAGGSRRAAHAATPRRGEDPRTHSRRRGASLEGAILQAVMEELAAVGYAHLTMEGVAARARTSKAVVYRRWPRRPELVIAAMRQQGPLLSGDIPDTGALRGDVLALLRRAAQGLSELGQETIYGLLADYFRDAELFSYLQSQMQQIGAGHMMTILQRAAARGEVCLDRVTRRIAALPVDLLRHELFVTRAPVPETVLIEIVDDIFLPLVRA